MPDAQADPVFERIDPRTLASIDNDTGAPNIRGGAQLDKDFIASVKANGVLVPVKVIDHGGRRVLRFGQRRVLAALEAGLDTIPALVYPSQAEADAAEAERIIEQWNENLAAPLTAGDRAAAVQELLGLDLPETQVRARLGLTRGQVKAARAVAASTLAADVARAYPVTLEQAAAVAEFDGDPDAQAALAVTLESEPHLFDHRVQAFRDHAERAAAVEARAAEVAAAGVTVTRGEAPPWNTRLHYLLPAPGAEDEFTEDTHKDCPGHAVWVGFDHMGNPDSAAYCTDPAGNGHASAVGGRTPGAAAQPDPQAQAKADAEATAERRRVRQGNTAWRSATAVRRQFAARLAHGRTATQPQVLWALRQVAAAPWWLDAAARDGHPHAAVLLGLAETPEAAGGLAGKAAAEPGVTIKRMQVIILGLVLGALEAQAGDVACWRDGYAAAAAKKDVAGYLGWLAEQGYALSPVEAAVAAGTRWEPEGEGDL